MSRDSRRTLFLVASVGFAALFLWGLAGLPDFGGYDGVYGETLNRVALRQRHATNLVAAVTFDYRGFDTMGEEYILFAAVVGVAILMRAQRDEEEDTPDDDARDRLTPRTSDAVRVLGLGVFGPIVLFGIYVVAHGHLTPGGGFQGGVVLATGVVLVYLAGRYSALRGITPGASAELAEAAGAAGYVGVGLLGLMASGTFLYNWLPFGTTGLLTSAGMIPFINLFVGLEVAGGFVLILTEFLEQTLVVREVDSGGPQGESGRDRS